MHLTTDFSLVSVAIGLGVLAVAAVFWKLAGPKILKPNSQTAYIVTGYRFPNVFKKDQFVVKKAPQAYLRLGSSTPEPVNLNSFSVKIVRKGIHDRKDESPDESLTLADHVKAEVDAEFYVRVNADKDEDIIRAKRSLREIDEKTVKAYLEPKFDSALRAAAAKMTIEEIQNDREKFLTTVKGNIELDKDGLELIDVALRNFRQAPLESFNANDYFDAQGLKKVTVIANESRQAVNASNQDTQTAIAQKDKEQSVVRLTIEQEKTQADLAQKQQIARLTAEQQRQVAEIQAEQKRQADMATIEAQQKTEQRRIESEQQIGVSTAQKDQATQVAQQQAQQATQSAEIAKQKAVELANRDKQIALQNKAAEVAEAEQSANIKRAEAVAAEQSVITAKEVAEAERERQVAVIEATREAQKGAEARKIDADADVIVAHKGAEAAREAAKGRADAQLTEATADSEAAQKRAAGAYQEQYQPLKALADGKLADAAAEEKLNEARNRLSEEARQLILELKRTEITPEVVQAFVAAWASIEHFNVTSIQGVPSLNGGAGAATVEGGSRGSNVFDQFYAAARQNMLTQPLLKKLITDMGGDPKIADNLPGIGPPQVSIVPEKTPAPVA